MSFAEKNKAWLLPLLGLGILGVVYMNIKLFTGDKPNPTPEVFVSQAPASSSSTSPSSPAAPAVSQAPPPRMEAVPDSSGDLWADLRSYAKAPDNLNESKALRDRARVRIGKDFETPSPLPLTRPSNNLESGMLQRKAVEEEAQAPSLLAPAPEVEFLVHSPSGAHAWFDGQSFRQGEALPGRNYSIEKIGTTFVVLKGPQGKTTQSTHAIHRVGGESPASEETP